MSAKSYILCPDCKSEVYEKEKEGKRIYFCDNCKKEVKPRPAKGWQ